MKITKARLKEIIKEELEESLEGRLGGPEGGDPVESEFVPATIPEVLDAIVDLRSMVTSMEELVGDDRVIEALGELENAVMESSDPSMVADDPRYY